MAMSFGAVLGQGILGAVAGGASAAAKNALEEQRAESERIREERLSKLRLQEYQARADIDISNAPRKAKAEAEGKAAGEEIVRPGIIETARQRGKVDTDEALLRERGKKEIEGEYIEQDAQREGARATARAKAEEPFKAADDRRRGDENIRVQRASAEEARRNNWRVDEEGFYIDGDGQRVRRSERVEGRTVEVFVKAPKSKIDGVTKGDPNWYLKEELDSINRRIEAASKSDFPDEERVAKLVDEKRALLKKLGMPDSTPSQAGGKPWERKWSAK